MGSSQSFPKETRAIMDPIEPSNNRNNNNITNKFDHSRLIAQSPSAESGTTTVAQQQQQTPKATSTDEAVVDALQSMPKMHQTETFEQKLYRKFSQEPLVPIGCVLTTYCLCSGIRSFMNQDAARSQLMMRGRVLAQTSTIVAFMFYAGWDNLTFFKPKDAIDKVSKD